MVGNAVLSYHLLGSNSNNLSDHLISHLAQSSDQNVHLSNTLFQIKYLHVIDSQNHCPLITITQVNMYNIYSVIEKYSDPEIH